MLKNKNNKIPFYLRPFEKILTQCTDELLVYLYDYCCKVYFEQCSYSEWLESVHQFMNNGNNEEC